LFAIRPREARRSDRPISRRWKDGKAVGELRQDHPCGYIGPFRIGIHFHKYEASIMDVKTAGRTVEIFETFAQAREPLSLADLARALGAPLSSILYLVRTLENRGYIYSMGTRKQVYPTKKLFDLAAAIAEGDSLVQRVHPFLAELRDKTMETVILGKRQGTRILYLAVLEGQQTIRYSSKVGDLKPLYASAIGKALLSKLGDAERNTLLGNIELQPITDATIIERSALMKDIESGTAKGFFTTRGENVPDVMAIARPVDIGGETYGVAIAGPLHRMARHADEHVALIDDYCAQLADLS
jgi:DNA-binding IclR family transcriptional regulator